MWHSIVCSFLGSTSFTQRNVQEIHPVDCSFSLLCSVPSCEYALVHSMIMICVPSILRDGHIRWPKRAGWALGSDGYGLSHSGAGGLAVRKSFLDT